MGVRRSHKVLQLITQAWRDFVASGGSSGPSARDRLNQLPSPWQALRARPLRAVVIIVAAFSAFALVSASFGGPGHTAWRSSYSSLADKGKEWIPNWGSDSASVGSSRTFGHKTQLQLLEPEFQRNPDDGLLYPVDVNPAKMNEYKRASACFVSLVRNGETESMRQAMREVESAFNRKFNYPWVFLNDEPFSDEFKRRVRGMTRAEIHFGLIPKEHWSYPSDIDLDKAADERRKMEEDHVIYGGSESYRHMCRFNSGFFYRHPLLQQFNYYWRVEPGVEFYCDVDYDVFHFMEANNKTYGFTVAIYEYERTIQSLWPTTREFAKKYPQHIAPDNSLNFLVDEEAGMEGRYNLCHFWSNFEIADMRFWRSQAYSDYFDYLDKTGNFFYERWGDAPVHSIAAALFLPSSRLHQFDDIGYRHNPYIHCPQNVAKYHDTGRCSCDPKSSFDEDGYSCMRQWWRIGKKPT